jgi:hypothetical protein
MSEEAAEHPVWDSIPDTIEMGSVEFHLALAVGAGLLNEDGKEVVEEDGTSEEGREFEEFLNNLPCEFCDRVTCPHKLTGECTPESDEDEDEESEDEDEDEEESEESEEEDEEYPEK